MEAAGGVAAMSLLAQSVIAAIIVSLALIGFATLIGAKESTTEHAVMAGVISVFIAAVQQRKA